ncbi:hypothetical protein LCGC14_2557640, partial [marine sediment metagenome]
TESAILAGSINTIAGGTDCAIIAGNTNLIVAGRASSSILAGDGIIINMLDQAAFTKDLALEASAASPSEGTHIYSAQPTPPGVSTSSGAISITVDSTDTSGQVTWTPTLANSLCTILFTEPYTAGSLPIVVITPRTAFGTDKLFQTLVTTAAFDVNSLLAGGLDFNYHVIAHVPLAFI